MYVSYTPIFNLLFLFMNKKKEKNYALLIHYQLKIFVKPLIKHIHVTHFHAIQYRPHVPNLSSER